MLRFGHERLPALIASLRGGGGTFEAACRRAGTTRHVILREMAENAEFEYNVRLACLLSPYRRRLTDKGGRPEIIEQAAIDAHRFATGLPLRTWEEVVADYQRMEADRRAAAAAMIDAPIPDGHEAF